MDEYVEQDLADRNHATHPSLISVSHLLSHSLAKCAKNDCSNKEQWIKYLLYREQSR